MSISWENHVLAAAAATIIEETPEFSTKPAINKKVKAAVQGLQRNTATEF
jgi:hypothetical protein